MTTDIELNKYQTSTDLVTDVLWRLTRYVQEVQAVRDTFNLCLSDGPMVDAVLSAVVDHNAIGVVDPKRIDVWWGYEIFNESQASRRASISFLSKFGRLVSPERVHPMPTDAGYADAEAASLAYTEYLGDVRMDLSLFNIASNGRIAGLPPRTDSQFSDRRVIAVRRRDMEFTSLSLRTINQSHQVWIMAQGEDSAYAVAQTLSGNKDFSGSHIRGTDATEWFIDDLAAEQLSQ
jgi:6-phosphogluconolactonase